MYFLSWIMSKKLTVKLINNKKIRIYKGIDMGQYEIVKSFEQQLKEEQEKLSTEIKEKIQRKKALMNPDTNYNKHRFRNITYKKQNS